MLKLDVDKLCQQVQDRERFRTMGRLCSTTGVVLTCTLPAAVGDQCAILTPTGRKLAAEVIGFGQGLAYLVPYERAKRFGPGCP